MTDAVPARPGFAGAFSIIILFAALARGAHDLWAATLVHAAALAWLAVLVASAHRRRETIRGPVALPAAVFLVLAGVSAAFAANRSDAVFAVKDLAAALVAFYAGANAFGTDDDLDVLLYIATPALWVQAVMAATQWVSRGGFGYDAPGALVNANIQAAFALFWVPPLGFRALRAKKEGARFFYFGSGVAAALISVALSGSTWAMLCLGTAAAGAWAVRRNRPGLTRRVFAAAAAVLILALFYKFFRQALLPAGWFERAGLPAPEGSDRLQWWISAIYMFLDHPWLGIGPGGYPSAYLAYKVGTGQSTLFAHSLPMTLFAELGVLGSAAAFWFVSAWRRAAGPAFPARGAYAAGALLFLIAALVNVGAEYLVNQLTLGLFLGIAVGTAPAPVWRPRASAAVVAGALAVLALPWLVSPFLAGRLIAEGRVALAGGQPAEAAKSFTSAAQVDGTSWEAWHGRALSLWPDAAARSEAIESQARAAELNRLNGQLWWELGLMLGEAGRKDEAIAALERAQRLRRRDPRVQADIQKLKGRSGESEG